MRRLTRAPGRGAPLPLPGGRDIAMLVALAQGQAAALGVAAFATRDAFAALHGGSGPEAATLALLLLAGLAGAVCALVARRRAAAMAARHAAALRRTLYAHLAGQDPSALARHRLGGLSLRFVGDLSAARRWFGQGLPRLVAAAVVLPAAAGVLLAIDPVLAWVALPPVALALGLSGAAARGLAPVQRALRGRRARLAGAMVERLMIAPHLDMMGRTAREVAALDEAGAELGRLATQRAMRVGLVRLIPQMGVVLGGGAILAVAGPAALTPATVAAGLSVLGILGLTLAGVATALDAAAAWQPARARVADLLSRPSLIRGVVPRGHPVALTLQPADPVVHDGPIDVEAGALVLIVGAPGSGADRLAAAIAGLERGRDWQIRYDGATAPLPRAAVLGDRPVVLRGSLRRAVTLGLSPRPGRRAIRAAARALGVPGLMARDRAIWPQRLGEGGRDTAPGLTLRLELVRIALTRPDLIVLDAARLWADPQAADLVARLHDLTGATLVATAPQARVLRSDMVLILPDPG